MPTYRTVATAAKVELKIEKSVFLGQAAATADLEAAKAFIGAIRAEHRQATHVCYAYRLGDEPGAVTYLSDHGEPAGTAGKPILGAILHRDLTDVTVVVTRYFGGKKLGVRGLIEAYGAAASAALDAAGMLTLTRLLPVRLACPYDKLPALTRAIRQAGGESAAPEYDAEKVTLAARIPVEALPALEAALAALSALRLT
ncbi:MAG: IMPACT family protein [Chitinophagales bacterium]